MILLNKAMDAVRALVPPQLVTIINTEVTVDYETGIKESVDIYKEGIAHIQRADKGIKEFVTGSIDAANITLFWMMNLSPELVDFVNSMTIGVSKLRTADGLEFTLIGKRDWSQNGWIKLYGVDNGRHISHL